MNLSIRSRLAAFTVGAGLLVAACGGTTTDQVTTPATQPSTAAPEVEQPATVEPDAAQTDAPTSDEPAQEAPPTEQVTEEPAPEEPAPAPVGENQLPDVDVIDLATGNEVNLASFAPADTPIILWFWAPH